MERREAGAGGPRISRRALLAGTAAIGAGVSLSHGGARLARAAAPRQQPPNESPYKVGIAIGGEQFSPPLLVEYAVLAEQAGFDGAWVTDHLQPWQENEGHATQAWVALGAIGSRTSRAMFGTGVTTPTFRYRPEIVAQTFATLGALYPGRIFLGIGSGESMNEVPGGGGFAPYAERAARMAEAITLIRRLWSGERVSSEGPYYPIPAPGLRIYDLPAQPIPIYVAASGPNSARIAGQLGDGWITDAKSAVDPAMRAAFADGARAAGKDPARLPIRVESFMVVGGEPEANEAAALWRFSPIGFKELLYEPDPRVIQARAEAELTLHDVWGDWTVSTNPADHAQNVRKFWDAGVHEVWVHSGQQDQRRVMDFYASQVLPLLADRP
ncbi:MAG TPA: TIGR03557 family F420-dependent LLM class oxidoreductase [Chloroflexota bacterium]|nr:TIGR03557 family F420-dependent LLM class oxidoreductase [Chloroflexota bacterium]